MSDFGGGQAQGSADSGSTGVPSGGGFQQQGNQNPQNQNPQGNQQDNVVDWGANDFLKNVAEADREAVGRYLKSIDAGISRRFQDLHEQYRPYQQFGDIEQVQQAMAIAELLENDPKQIYDALAEALKDELSQGTPGNNGNGNLDPNLQGGLPEGLPPEFIQQWQQQQQALEAVAQYILDQQTTQQQQEQDRALEQQLTQLKAEFGDFDTDFVLAKALANGGDLVKAVQSYQETISKNMTGMGQLGKLPPILGGGGVVPQQNSQSVKDLSRSDTQELVAQLLAAQAQP